jgi:hypothetical protein
MKKNYKLQNTNNTAQELHELTRISEKKERNITTTKGSHGLHQGSFKLQTMTTLIKSFYGGSRGAVFSKRAPLAAGGEVTHVDYNGNMQLEI